jgi:hypothetical protein
VHLHALLPELAPDRSHVAMVPVKELAELFFRGGGAP